MSLSLSGLLAVLLSGVPTASASTGAISGTIIYDAGFTPGSTITVVVSTDMFRGEMISATVTSAGGTTVAYSLELPAPESYVIGAFVGDNLDSLSPSTPLGFYQDFTLVPLSAGETVSGKDFSLALDGQSPTSGFTSPAAGSTITALSTLEGTATDNLGAEAYPDMAALDLTNGKWWSPWDRVWIATTTTPLYYGVGADAAGKPSTFTWTMDISTGSGGWRFGGLAGYLANNHRYRLYASFGDYVGNRQAPPATAEFTWDGPTGDLLPPAPEYVDGSALGTSSIAWRWGAVTDATGYSVYESSEGPLIAAVATNTYTSAGFSTNTGHMICVSASNEYGESPRKCLPYFLFTLAAVPGEPRALVRSSTTITWEWDPETNPAATFYELALSTDDFASGAGALLGFNFSTGTATTGLEPDTTYYARVRAANGNFILTGFSGSGSTKTLIAAPLPPVNLSAVFDRVDAAVNLSWEPAPTGSPAVYFDISRSASPTGSFVLISTGLTATSYIDRPPASAAYYYRVYSVGEFGAPSTLPATANALFDVIPPQAVTGLGLAGLRPAQNEVVLSWTAPSDDYSGVSRYLVLSSTMADFSAGVATQTWDSSAVPGSTVTATVWVSTTQSQYFAVIAQDAVGNESSRSTSILVDAVPPVITSFNLAEGEVVSRPRLLNVQASDNQGFFDSLFYKIDGVVVSTISYGQPHAYFWDTRDYAQDGPHSVEVIVRDNFGNEAALSRSVTVVYSTPAAPVFYAPQEGFTTRVATVSVQILAEPYTAVRVLADSVEIATAALGQNAWLFTTVSLPAEGDIALAAVTFEPRGESSTSTPVHVAYFSEPPLPPESLFAAVDLQARSITLSWQPAASGTLATAFNVYRGTQPAGAELLRSGVTTFYYLDQPLLSATYYYRISATHGAGLEGQPSSPVSAFFDIYPPQPVSDLRAGDYRPSQAQLDLIWTAPQDDFSGLSRYVLYDSTTGVFDAGSSSTVIQAISQPGETDGYTVSVATTQTRYFRLKAGDRAGNLSTFSNTLFFDPIPPQIVSVDLAEGPVVSRPRSVTVQATDNVGLAQVLFRVDGATVASMASPPYSFIWDTRLHSDGMHVLRGVAYDVAGNTGIAEIPVTLNYMPPAAPTILSPATGYATTVATVSLSGIAEAGTTVQLLINGGLASSVWVPLQGGIGGFQFTDVPLASEGVNTLNVRSSDIKGASANSSAIQVFLYLAAPPPPQGVTAEAQPGGTVRLDWVVPSTGTVAFYRVYRSTDETVFLSTEPLAAGLRIADNVVAVPFLDSPSTEAAYFYAVTANDPVGNESYLSDIVSAVSDRGAPSASFQLESATGPLGPGQHPLLLTVSENLVAIPIVTFTPLNGSPLPVNLAPLSPLVWRGTVTVTSAMQEGAANLGFQGSDYVGNVGTTIIAGGTLVLDTKGPLGAVSLGKASPVGPGPLALTLTLNEPAVSTPSLSFTPYGGSPLPIALAQSVGSTDNKSWSGTILVSSGTGDGQATFAFSGQDLVGNAGDSLSGGTTFFVVDAVPPGAPRYLTPVPGKAGVVQLSWTVPLGERPSRYTVYRDGERIADAVPVNSDGSGTFSDLPAEGSHEYAVSALDAAANEGSLSDPVSATSDATAPPAPANLTAVLYGFGQIQITWEPGAGESLASYRLYRTTHSISTLAGLTPRPAASPYLDSPTEDATYHYVVTSLDSAGNESPPSSEVSLLFDKAAPRIAVSGVAEGGFYNGPVLPSWTVADGNLDPSSARGALDGNPFVSGSMVSAEGGHVLLVTASDTEGHASTATVSFTLDLTTPAINISGVQEGGVYRGTVAAVITATDLHLLSTSYLLTNLTLNTTVPYSSGEPMARNGSYVLRAQAQDRAGNDRTSEVSFTLEVGPIAPLNLAVEAAKSAGARLTWQKPEPGVIAYRVYRDDARISASLYQETSFQDSGFIAGTERVYEVSAVDYSGIEGPKARVTVPAVSLELAGYGTARDGKQYLTRGFFDSVRFSVANAGSESLSMGPASLEFVDQPMIQTVPASAVSLASGESALLTGIVATPPSLPGSVSLKARLPVPSEPGTSLALVRSFTLESSDPVEPVVEILPGVMTPGAMADVQVRLHNRGSAAMDLLTGQMIGASPAPVDSLVARLKTPEGTLLAQGGVLQTGGGASGLYLDGKQWYFVSIPAGSNFLFEPIELLVPDAAGSSAKVSVVVATPSYSLAFNPVPGTRRFEGLSSQVLVSSIAYTATVSVERAYYDQGSSMTFTGTAKDSLGGLLPYSTVTVHVLNRGYDRHLTTVTDEAGAYAAVFYPLPNEAGIYQVSATHPDIVTHLMQASFTIVDLEYQYREFTASIAQNSQMLFTVRLTNTGEAALTGLAGEVVLSTSAPGVRLSLDPASLPGMLSAGAQVELRLTASAEPTAQVGAAYLFLVVSESHGFTRTLPVKVKVGASLAIPTATPQMFELGMAAGESRTQAVTLKNEGFAPWLQVRLSQPTLGWVHIDGLTDLGDIQPGGNSNFSLRIEPPSSLPNQSYAQNPLLEVYSLNAATVSINAGIVVTSSKQGGLVFQVINADEQRDANDNGVPIAGAVATLTSLDIAGLAFKITGDANGIIEFQNVPSGKYAWTVEAPGFLAESGTTDIQPGLTKTIESVMATATVTYEWTVTPTTITDVYQITLQQTFKTDVPAPVVVLDPPIIHLNVESHVEVSGQFTVSNKGIVSAFDVTLQPSSPDGEVKIDLPFTKIPELRPGETVVVPYKISHGQLAGPACHNHPAAIGAVFVRPCAAGIIINGTCVPIKITVASELKSCAVGDGSVGGARPPTGGGGIWEATKQWISAMFGTQVVKKQCRPRCKLKRERKFKESDLPDSRWETECMYECDDGYLFYDYLIGTADVAYDCEFYAPDPRGPPPR
ncbi:MAG: hypothetical protein HY748_04100 [Elusimicrobia bacterium]|nr:hypothetical protein [Elusimicrobiota bacterium]